MRAVVTNCCAICGSHPTTPVFLDTNWPALEKELGVKHMQMIADSEEFADEFINCICHDEETGSQIICADCQ